MEIAWHLQGSFSLNFWLANKGIGFWATSTGCRPCDTEISIDGFWQLQSLDAGPPRRACPDHPLRRRPHQAKPGWLENATRHRNPRRHGAPDRARRNERPRSYRRAACRGAHLAREPAREDGPRHGAALRHQDPRRLRLLVPTLARQEPHHGARRVAVHRPRRGLAPDR